MMDHGGMAELYSLLQAQMISAGQTCVCISSCVKTWGFHLRTELMIRHIPRIYTAELLLHHGEFLRRECVSCCISWAQSRCRSVCLSLSHTHTDTHSWPQAWHTSRHSFLLFIKRKSQQTMPNQWAGLIDKRLQWDTSEQRAQTEQIGGEKSETIIHPENSGTPALSSEDKHTRVHIYKAVANGVSGGIDSRGP